MHVCLLFYMCFCVFCVITQIAVIRHYLPTRSCVLCIFLSQKRWMRSIPLHPLQENGGIEQPSSFANYAHEAWMIASLSMKLQRD